MQPSSLAQETIQGVKWQQEENKDSKQWSTQDRWRPAQLHELVCRFPQHLRQLHHLKNMSCFGIHKKHVSIFHTHELYPKQDRKKVPMKFRACIFHACTYLESRLLIQSRSLWSEYVWAISSSSSDFFKRFPRAIVGGAAQRRVG